jgi:hypothetical protein
MAPVYVSLALGRIVVKNVKVGAIRPLLWYFPLIALGQCYVIAGVIRGLARDQKRSGEATGTVTS